MQTILAKVPEAPYVKNLNDSIKGSTIQQNIQEHILLHVPQLIRCELCALSLLLF